ncbi:Efflux pump [Lachnellula hyalina]|uniref:Efflux pump n=1 Tax=Lachnellula hyalina TaxID=1316788 RepID=A0A8H8QWW7_9HELO|nr:Efflux pump [Lachnellula hyalina]TVY24313.1 Efflux pump [Lachnellula hyalina]
MKFRNSAQCSNSPPSMDTKSEVSTEIVKPSTVSRTEKDPDVENSKVEEESQEKELTYLHGWRLYISTVALWIIIYLVNMEASIVSTALVAMTSDLHGFDKSSWIVSGYQISYTGFLVIWAKMSDIFGRKYSLMTAVFIFAGFSGACGAAQTMTQLIVVRVLQGIGASGAFAVTMAIVYEMVPKAKLPLYTGICFIIVALATTSGPLMGGAIVTRGSWRWLFLLNVPAAAIVFVVLLICMPAQFGTPKNSAPSPVQKDTIWRLLKKIDVIGAVLLLGASFLLVTALLEASTSFTWSSAVVIALLVLSVGKEQEEMFPWRFVKNRAWMAMLLVSFLVGIPNSAILISIPQRYQVVDSSSPLQAGIRLLPYTIANPIGLLVGNTIGGATKIAPIYLLFGSSLIQLLGIALLDMIPVKGGMLASMYVFEILIALGVGVTASVTMLATPHCVESKDLAVGTSSMVQARMLGSAIGLAIAMSVLNSNLSASLGSALLPSQITSLLQDFDLLNTFNPNLQEKIRSIFGTGFRLENRIIIAIAGVQVLAVGLMWKKQQISLHSN